jgi:hypothetical protein
MRNIAPCISCHGGVDQKFGTPWLEGMPQGYLVAQLEAFAPACAATTRRRRCATWRGRWTPREIRRSPRSTHARRAAGRRVGH